MKLDPLPQAFDCYIITAIALYSTGHWIGGTVAIFFAAVICYFS